MPKGRRRFHFVWERTGLTRFGGLYLLQRFCKSLGLRQYLQLTVHWPRTHHRVYHPADLFLAHVFGLVAGIGRIENMQSLIHDGLLPSNGRIPDLNKIAALFAFAPSGKHES